jgi:hypothetical protein
LDKPLEFQILNFDGFVKSRLSRESRSPDYLKVFESHSERDWIPAPMGMAEKNIFRLFAGSLNFKFNLFLLSRRGIKK